MCEMERAGCDVVTGDVAGAGRIETRGASSTG